ncbi:ARM repeat-containing protein [Trichocladium antarcticum]|uniref:ARM repeat-containing protein n=1 Tax=Trichocladium antarcticum TaxID=1450529 RepID=A0AAN6ZEJ2_9PEZI|nr:ARM repeat-containing protein [Trichocladium antarcticum]
MAPRRSAAGATAAEPEPEQEQDTGASRLQFNEPLTWRPGKPIPLDTLLKRLDRLTKELSEMDQETTDPASLAKVAKEVASHQLLNHKDKGVRAYTACCVVDILRLCAPDAPFTPSQLKDVFSLTVTSIIPALFQPSNPYNNQHKYVLRSLAEIKSIVLLLDVDGSESLLLHLFSAIFDGVSGSKPVAGEQVARDVEYSMQELLGVLVEDATSLPAKVVDVMMAQFLRAAAPGTGRERHNHVPLDDNQATLLAKEEPEAYQIVKHLCQMFPDKMARFVSQYFSDVIVDATGFAGRADPRDGDVEDDEDGPSGPSESDLRELRKAHTLIREIWKAAPQILQNVVPQVDAELSADNVHLRQLATETLGDMISGIGAAGPPPPPVLDPAAYPPLRLEDDDKTETPAANILTTPLSAISFSQTHNATFHNFLSRKNDKIAAIRAAWTTAVGHILSTSAGGIGLGREDETALIQGIGEKLSDADERVRLAAVKAIECFGFRDVILKLGPLGGVTKDGSILSTLADRSRDKKPVVRVAAMSLLGKLWAAGTGELLAGNEAVTAALGGIPTRIYSSFYANDPELNVLLDRVIYECLVPPSYPPLKKASKAAASNGNSQSQAAGPAAPDQDAIRAERILLLIRSLDPSAKKAFFAMQARQPQFSKVVHTLLKQCDLFNGGVMDNNADIITANLLKTSVYIAQFFPDEVKTKQDLYRFAKVNDRRNYNLVKYVIGQEHDFKTVHKALKELVKRIQTSKDPGIRDAILPLMYRSGSFMFNRSHLATIMEYSRSDKDGLGAAAHEILNEISQRNPDLFKTHIGQLCKDLVDQAPTATRENEPVVVETLKACSTYARKYPKDVPVEREFTKTMINYALYGQPARAAKYAVNILLSKKDDRGKISATDLLQRTLKDWTYGTRHFLNKLAAVSQLELLAPKVTQAAEDTILDMAVQQVLLEVRKEASDRDPDWVDDAELDEECQAKCLALKILANRLRSMEDVGEAKEKAKPVWKLFMKLIRSKGELSRGKPTPTHHRSRLRLLAAQLLLKLSSQKHFDDLLSPEDFDTLALTAQDAVQEVRHGFVKKLQKYLADGKLRSRFYTIVFLMAFEPSTEFKQRTETWIRSRARHFQDHKQQALESTMARLLSLLAHHPDYSANLDELVDHARYLLFYISLVATESNLGLIYKYAERVKQTQDALDPGSNNHQVLSDLAQAAIRKWQAKKNWVFGAYPGKVGLPLGLYTALRSHDEAQQIAETQLVPDGIDEKLDELLRAMDRKKKRKSVDGSGETNPPTKRTRTQQPREPRTAKSVAKKAAAAAKQSKGATPGAAAKKSTKKTEAASSTERRKSGRSRGGGNQSYIERDSDDDDEEMLDGVAEWEYEGQGGWDGSQTRRRGSRPGERGDGDGFGGRDRRRHCCGGRLGERAV